MKKTIKKIMQILIIIVFLFIAATFLYLQHNRFGGKPAGERLERMKNAPNYKDGAFENLEYTPEIAEGKGLKDAFYSFLFEKDKRNIPKSIIPVIKTDLQALPVDSNMYIWFGHSSYYLQLDGKRILVDPVFSAYASPVRIRVRAFSMEHNFTAADMPHVDILIITHDHWDHLDYNTFKQIQHKVGHIVTSLGVGAHLEKWGYPTSKITELYWGESVVLEGFNISSTPARHFTGRKLKRNGTLWSSFVLTGSKNIFLGGDSGYGKHFKEIGTQFGPFDYAILENGQYNELWKYIHMMPEEVIQAGKDLRARYIMPVHSAKFPLANHAWDEPLNRVSSEAQKQGSQLVIPKIGQVVSLDNYQEFSPWWSDLH